MSPIIYVDSMQFQITTENYEKIICICFGVLIIACLSEYPGIYYSLHDIETCFPRIIEISIQLEYYI